MPKKSDKAPLTCISEGRRGGIYGVMGGKMVLNWGQSTYHFKDDREFREFLAMVSAVPVTAAPLPALPNAGKIIQIQR